MAQFYAGIKGNRGNATRLGTKVSGMDVFGNGWEIGVKANLTHNKTTGRDEIQIYLTKGSNRALSSSVLLWQWNEEEADCYINKVNKRKK